jgi:glycosyltransferase involved in cell wall biosynthesis
MISMIIPSYNRVNELRRCMESVISQFYDGLEVIVIDDFSTDATRDYLAKLGIEHPSIKIHQKSRC